uniref:Uncharacterized protein n=1 Tax=Xiphophorus maculatus TaxID=8083 RepID=A0A3B5QHF6_XIPMA
NMAGNGGSYWVHCVCGWWHGLPQLVGYLPQLVGYLPQLVGYLPQLVSHLPQLVGYLPQLVGSLPLPVPPHCPLLVTACSPPVLLPSLRLLVPPRRHLSAPCADNVRRSGPQGSAPSSIARQTSTEGSAAALGRGCSADARKNLLFLKKNFIPSTTASKNSFSAYKNIQTFFLAIS